jgi:hypothetical protein
MTIIKLQAPIIKPVPDRFRNNDQNSNDRRVRGALVIWTLGNWNYIENKMVKNLLLFVFPVKAGIQPLMGPCFRRDRVWIPPYTGMTTLRYCHKSIFMVRG